MRRRFVLIMTCTMLCLPATAAAGGGSWLETADGSDLRQANEVVTLSGRFWGGTQAAPSDGPWFATLKATDGEHTRVPLGPVTVRSAGDHWFASVTFTVPDVPIGEYWVEVANEHGNGVGDLMGGSLRVAPSAAEWRVHVLQDRRKELIHRMREERATARSILHHAKSARVSLEQELDAASERAATAEAALEAARADTSSARPLVPGWAVTVLALCIVGSVLMIGAGRRRRGGRPADSGSIDQRAEERSRAA